MEDLKTLFVADDNHQNLVFFLILFISVFQYHYSPLYKNGFIDFFLDKNKNAKPFIIRI